MPEGEPKRWDNEYFGGAVRSVNTMISGRRATRGEIDPGSYEFTTVSEERFTVTRGEVEIKLSGELEFGLYVAGEMIVIPANSSFAISATELVLYDCVYIDPVPDESDDGGY